MPFEKHPRETVITLYQVLLSTNVVRYQLA